MGVDDGPVAVLLPCTPKRWVVVQGGKIYYRQEINGKTVPILIADDDDAERVAILQETVIEMAETIREYRR